MKRKILAIISLSMVAVIVLLCCTSCAVEDAFNEAADKVEDGVEDLTGELSLEIEDTPQIRLMSLAVPASTDSNDFLIASLRATVLPENLTEEERTLEWSVYWIDNRTGDANADVNDYLTVTPEWPDGSEVTLRAYKEFRDSIIGVKATAKFGGQTAVCRVMFEGNPTTFQLYPMSQDGSISSAADNEILYSSNTYRFKMVLGNNLNDVSDRYNRFEIVDYSQSGYVRCDDFTYEGEEWREVGYEISTVSCPLPDFMTCSISGDVLTVTVKSLSELTYEIADSEGHYISGIEDCNFTIRVRESQCGLSYTLNLKIGRAVDQVILEYPDIYM